MEELFLKVIGFPDYSISNHGRLRYDSCNNYIIKPAASSSGYYVHNIFNGDTFKRAQIHRLVAEAFIPNPDNKPVVDHIDGNRQNNRAENLRWATYSENCMNTKIARNNTSGYKGVGFDKKANKWKATIIHNKKTINLGSYSTKEEALIARLNAVEKFFGEFASNGEKELILNIKVPKHTKLKLTINIDDDEEYKNLEKEFEELVKN
jgi:hypothetical protein